MKERKKEKKKKRKKGKKKVRKTERRKGGQGPYLRSLNHFASSRGGGPNKTGQTDQLADRRIDRLSRV